MLREGQMAFILRESGAKELYWMGTDPTRSGARHAPRTRPL
jgi:hypothetical protein